MAEASYTIDNFVGGISDEEKRGVPGAFKNGWNLNIHQKNKNTLIANQKLKKISGTTVVDKIIKMVPVTSAIFYAFGDAGNIYKVDGETVTKKYTDPDGVILDGDYFYGYLYWTTKTHLKRHLETTASWTDVNCAALTPDSGTFNTCDYHPIFIVPKSDLMTVGNGRYVATVSSVPYLNAEALDLFYGWEVRCLSLEKPNLLIGAMNNKQAEMFTWDLSADSYDPVEGWQERGINAFLKLVGATYIFTPTILYWYNQGLADQAKELPSEITPGAIDIWKGKVLFASNKGVNSYHRRNKNYPLALNLEYTTSAQSVDSDTGELSTIDIGAILGLGEYLYVGWKNGDTYGIDIIDNDNKADAVYEGLMFDAARPSEEKLFNSIKVVTKELPAGCSIKIKYRMQGSDTWVKTYLTNKSELFDTDGETKAVFTMEGHGEYYEMRIELYSSGNDSPEVLSINSYFEALISLY